MKEARIRNLLSWAKGHPGGHRLCHARGFTFTCEQCNWQGVKACLPPACSKLCRGGQRLSTRQFAPSKVDGDGMCTFGSLSHFTGLRPRDLRNMVCDTTALSAGTVIWKGQQHCQRAQQDTGLCWLPYAQAMRCGNIWPGALEQTCGGTPAHHPCQTPRTCGDCISKTNATLNRLLACKTATGSSSAPRELAEHAEQ